MSRVLVVDDSDFIAHLLVTLLTDNGHHTIEVSDQAQRLLDPMSDLWADLDVLVTDLRMPGASGMEVLATAAKHHPRVFRIVLTGYDPDSEQILVLQDLAHRVLHKPQDVLEVVRIVDVLDRSR